MFGSLLNSTKHNAMTLIPLTNSIFLWAGPIQASSHQRGKFGIAQLFHLEDKRWKMRVITTHPSGKVPPSRKRTWRRARRITVINLETRIVSQQWKNKAIEWRRFDIKIFWLLRMTVLSKGLRPKSNTKNTKTRCNWKLVRSQTGPNYWCQNIMTKMDRKKKTTGNTMRWTDAVAAARVINSISPISCNTLCRNESRLLITWKTPRFGADSFEIWEKMSLSLDYVRQFQGKMLERRTLGSESELNGLNCGGHAFESDGFLRVHTRRI